MHVRLQARRRARSGLNGAYTDMEIRRQSMPCNRPSRRRIGHVPWMTCERWTGCSSMKVLAGDEIGRFRDAVACRRSNASVPAGMDAGKGVRSALAAKRESESFPRGHSLRPTTETQLFAGDGLAAHSLAIHGKISERLLKDQH
jgi:hypothetical protein